MNSLSNSCLKKAFIFRYNTLISSLNSDSYRDAIPNATPAFLITILKNYFQNLMRHFQIKTVFKLFLLSTLTFISSFALAQNSNICGKIVTMETQEPIMFASVALYESGVLISGVESDLDGYYCLVDVASGVYSIEVSYIGYATKKVSNIKISEGETANINIGLNEGSGINLDEVVVINYKAPLIRQEETSQGNIVTSSEIRNLPRRNINGLAATSAGVGSSDRQGNLNIHGGRTDATVYYIDGVVVRGNLIPGKLSKRQLKKIKKHNIDHDRQLNPSREDYTLIKENEFQNANESPLSTFSIDVDRASYSNLRRFINQGQMPPVDAIRIEEMINYFDYEYDQPLGQDAFTVHTEYADCPWNKKNKLLHIGIQGKEVSADKIPDANLVFLIDVSGSMNSQDKLPLVKESLMLLIDKLKPTDRIALVTYAGQSQLRLPPTQISQKAAIKSAIQGLSSGGSTAGASGIKLAYSTARKYFLKDGNNRIILATDGDFNVGVSSNSELERIIEKEREGGIFLSVLGYGTGNYQDSKMQILADKGNGNHAYIDQIKEAEKELVKEMAGTLLTIAKDMKIQIEFNPNTVSSYRLIGYENRMLATKDFNDDKKDAGELGSGHTVTAIYEITPQTGKGKTKSKVDELKYQNIGLTNNKYSGELATIKLRFKKPQGKKSSLIAHTISSESVAWEASSTNLKWASAIAQFGMTIRGSQYLKDYDYDKVLALAESGLGSDDNGYRDEAIQMMQRMKEIHDPSLSKK